MPDRIKSYSVETGSDYSMRSRANGDESDKLTTACDGDGSARSENVENTGIVEAGVVSETVLDLQAGQKDERMCLSARQIGDLPLHR